MPRVIHIDANNQQISFVQIGGPNGGLKDLQRLVSGSIAVACHMPDNHVLFVDDEGLFKPQRWFFRLLGQDRPYAGNGVICGPERYDRDGEYLGTADVSARWLPAVMRAVEFRTRVQIDAWAKATASEPEIAIIGDDGIAEVIAYRGQLWGDMPKPR